MILSIDEATLEDQKAIEEIFFESSSIKDFKDEKEKIDFKFKYLDYYKDKKFFFYKKHQEVLGYICGVLKTSENMFDLYPYYKELNPSLLERFPSHLHINLSKKSRGRGIGSLLIEHFIQSLKREKICGVHIFTGTKSRNISFYEKNSFGFALSVRYHKSLIKFMAREISSSITPYI